MTKIVGVRFRPNGKIYYFQPQDLHIENGDPVIVETARGIEFGHVVLPPREVSNKEITAPLKDVLRVATAEDIAKNNENKEAEKKAFAVCQQKIAQHNLPIKLVEVSYAFDVSKIIFYFTADGRVDFRDLVKDLASVFRTRIELRQIGVRDEAKMLGGLGACGRSLCCGTFLSDFQPVSIRMAKDQNLSLNPTKISGSCGRLMCCLKYEQDVYEELLKLTPKVGAIVMTEEGKGMVVDTDL
ncbi:MAG: stage 0 sporulation family protein, partial [Firmicutes bacterium]|nr:stage 0 sporulation family protein [Bacillota bacterium]